MQAGTDKVGGVHRGHGSAERRPRVGGVWADVVSAGRGTNGEVVAVPSKVGARERARHHVERIVTQEVALLLCPSQKGRREVADGSRQGAAYTQLARRTGVQPSPK